MTCEWWDGNDVTACIWCGQPAGAHARAVCLECDGKGHVGDESEDNLVRTCEECDGAKTVPVADLLKRVA